MRCPLLVASQQTDLFDSEEIIQRSRRIDDAVNEVSKLPVNDGRPKWTKLNQLKGSYSRPLLYNLRESTVSCFNQRASVH